MNLSASKPTRSRRGAHAPKGEKYVLDDERTFANLAQKTRPNAEAAVVLAYKMKGPCTTKAALEYARALPDPASIGSLKRADAVLKRAGIVITESVRMARDRTKAVADIESLYQERIHLDHKVLGLSYDLFLNQFRLSAKLLGLPIPDWLEGLTGETLASDQRVFERVRALSREWQRDLGSHGF